MQQTVVKEIMDAIDFKKLLREERKRSKKITNIFRHQEIQKQSQTYDVKDSVHSIENNNNDNDGNAVVDLYYNNKWNYPIDSSGILELRELKLQSICENPKSILYSSTALQKQVITHSINNNSGDDNKAAKTEMVSISPEKALMNWLQNIPSGDSGLENWKTMNYGKRKVCMFGENTNTEYQIGQGRQQQHSSSTKLPPPLAEIAKELVKRDIFPSSYPPNHVLLNEYNPGEGILPHTDGPSYEHCTATLSLGSDAVMEFSKRLKSNEIGTTATKIATENNNSTNRFRNKQVLLESGSLLVFQGDAYLNYCHEIPMTLQDITTDNCLNNLPNQIISRGRRYSLTFRHKI